jgi:hypothetical protein
MKVLQARFDWASSWTVNDKNSKIGLATAHCDESMKNCKVDI